MVTPSAQNENTTLQESIPVTITGHRKLQQHLLWLIQQPKQ